MDIRKIKPYKKNPRNNKKAVKYVAKSIEEFGFRSPIIVDKNHVIICGHTRYSAAKKLGLTDVPVIVADDLTDEQVKAYRLADNKVSEKATWDEADKRSFAFCFDGLPQGGTIAVSTIGVKLSDEASQIWVDGMDECLKRAKPNNVIVYGGDIGYKFDCEVAYINNAVTERMYKQRGNDDED